MDAVGHVFALDFSVELVDVAAMGVADDDEVDVVGQFAKGLHGGDLVLAVFDGAYADDVFFGEVVGGAGVGLGVLGDGLPEDVVAGLVDDSDFGFGHLEVCDEVALGLLADGDDDVGDAAGVALLGAVGDAVEGFVELRVAPYDEVVHGDHFLDGVGYAVGQLVAEAVEDVDFVAFQVDGDAVAAPEVGEVAVDARRLAGGDVGEAGEIALVLAIHYGRVKEGAHPVVLLCQAANEHPAVITQACIVLKRSFSIEAYNHCMTFKVEYLAINVAVKKFLQKYKKKTYLCKF